MWVAPEEIPSHPVISAFAAYLQGGIVVTNWLKYLDKNPWIEFGALCLEDGSWQIERDGIPSWLLDASTFIDYKGVERTVLKDQRRKVLLIK